MVLVVGLGNPGKEFDGTRHNTGFAAIERLAGELGVTFKKEAKFSSLVARSGSKKAILIKPLTYMNLSGQAVQSMAAFYQLAPVDVWVISDDVDLPVGTARIKGKGTGESTHNGIRSIAESLGTADFARFRIGTAQSAESGKVGVRPSDLKQFVLQPFDTREQHMVELSITWIVDEILAALKRGTVTSRSLT